MKKIISTVLVCVLLVSTLFVLASCGKTISGTYSAKQELFGTEYEVTYEFDGKNVTVTSKASNTFGSIESPALEGTYEIGKDDDGNKTITFDYSGEDDAKGAAEEGVELSFNQGKDDKGKYIEISGTKFYEVK